MRREMPLAESVDAIVDAAMTAFNVPGMAVAVVKNGRLVHSRGYGVRETGKSDPVTPRTVFAIASCTKAFTSAAAAMLVDEKKMAWDDPVRKHIPFFHLPDPASDVRVTIADLLSHRTGMPRSDALWYGSTASREQIIRRAIELAPVNPIRGAYEYNNLMYTAAGYAIGLTSGLGYEGFIRKRIFAPLGMRGAVLSCAQAQAADDHATPHMTDKSWASTPIPWRNIDPVCPTGGIAAGVEDLAKWVAFQLAGGEWKGRRLVSKDNLLATRTPMILSATSDEPGMPTLSAYAMGWEVFDQMGVKVVAHSGGIDGFASQTVLLPRLNTGFVVLSNIDRAAPLAVRRGLIAVLGGFRHTEDSLERTLEEERKEVERRQKLSDELMAKRNAGTSPSHPSSAFAGAYSDAAYGTAEIVERAGSLAMEFNGAVYAVEHFHYDTFLIRLPRPEVVDNPGTLTFSLGPDGSVESYRWRHEDWGIDRAFRRVRSG